MLVLGRKWLSSCACSAGNGSRRLPARCRSKINKRIDTIENRLQKEADKKDGRDLDDIEADKDKAERAVAKAEKLTKYVQGTLEAVDGGAMPRPPAPVLPKSLFVFASRRWSLWIRALVRGFHKLHVDLQYMQFVKTRDNALTPVCVALRLQAAQEVVPDFPEDDCAKRAQAVQQAPRQERTLRRSEVQPQEQDVSSACCLAA